MAKRAKNLKHVAVYGEPDRPAHLYKVTAGDGSDYLLFYVLAKSFDEAVRAVFERFGATTDADLPKPFAMDRVDAYEVVVVL